MHRCLHVAEILQYIIRDIDDNWWRLGISSEAKATYSSLARTCRIFYEPSMNALWGKMDSLDPFNAYLTREEEANMFNNISYAV